MPYSGDPAGKRKRGDASLLSPKRHKSNHGKNPQIKVRGIIKWNLRSRGKITDETNSPSTSRSTIETTTKKGIKRNAAEETNNFEGRNKQRILTAEYRKNKAEGQLKKNTIPTSDTKEKRNSAHTKEREISEEILGAHDNENCMENATREEQRIGKTTQERKMNLPLSAAVNEIEEILKNVNQLKENKSNTEILTTNEMDGETTCTYGDNSKNSEEGASDLRNFMEKSTSMNEEEDIKLELEESERLSGEEIGDGKNKNESSTGIPSIAQASSFMEDCAAETSGYNSSISNSDTEIPLESKKKLEEKIL